MSRPSNYRLIAFITACAFFMDVLDGTIINTSLPQMARAFGVPVVQLSLGVTAYLLSVAAFIPLSGWIADRFGARNVFAAAIVIFMLASIACGLSNNLPTFAVARAFQGLGGALMAPVGRLVVLRSAQKSDLLNAIAMITWPALTGPVIGPALGGFITTYVGWRWNFFVNIPIALAGVTMVLLFVPNSKSAERQPLDLKGFVLSSAALIGLLYGCESLAHGQLPKAVSAGLAAFGAVCGWLAVRHFRRVATPLLNLSSLKIETFATSTVGPGMVMRVVISATPFLLPLLFQVGFGLSAWAAGQMILVYFLGNLMMKTVTTPILKRWGFRTILAASGVIGGLAIGACALLSPGTPTPLILAVLMLAGMSRSMQFTSLNTVAFADVSPDQRTSATTLSSMLQQAATVLGVAVGAILLSLSQGLRSAPALGLADFRLAFGLAGITGVCAGLWFLRLPPQAGAEVSGRSAS